MRVVDVRTRELEEGPGRDGFWFRAAPLGGELGARRIGAGLYEAREGIPIWPYHYHYPDEEWLYVLDGSPVLRDISQDRRALVPGDVVCFPAGHRGAHTVDGPGRFIIFSGERSSGPFVSVYPDSDKVSIFPGCEPPGLNALRLGRAGSVDYWHGEGRGPVAPSPVTREPEDVSGPAVVNVLDRSGPLGEALGAAQLDAAALDLDPHGDCGPYRYECGRELWLLGLAGATTVQGADGERTLSPGELTCLPEGPEGGRRLRNDDDERPARVLLLWSAGFPAATCCPETGDWVLRAAAGAPEIRLRGAQPAS